MLRGYSPSSAIYPGWRVMSRSHPTKSCVTMRSGLHGDKNQTQRREDSEKTRATRSRELRCRLSSAKQTSAASYRDAVSFNCKDVAGNMFYNIRLARKQAAADNRLSHLRSVLCKNEMKRARHYWPQAITS